MVQIKPIRPKASKQNSQFDKILKFVEHCLFLQLHDEFLYTGIPG